MDINAVQLLLSGLAAFGIVYLSVPVLEKIAYKWDLYDKPDNERKLHKRYVPTLGGIGIFIAMILSVSLSGHALHIQGFPYFIAALVILFFTGLKDDLIGLSPAKKMTAQVISIVLIIFGCDLTINNFYGVLGLDALPVWGAVGITIFTMVVIINAFNLIDGIDGLAGGIGLTASLIFCAIFWSVGSTEMAVIATMLSTSLLGFLIYNRHPAAIFMGDTGSLIVGFMLAYLAVNFISLNEHQAYTVLFNESSQILVVGILSVPLYDTIRVFGKRLVGKRSPFSAGKDHVHHELLSMGLGHTAVTVTLIVATLLITAIGIAFSAMDSHIMLGAILLSTVLLMPTNGFKRRVLSKVGIDIGLEEEERPLDQESVAAEEEYQPKVG